MRSGLHVTKPSDPLEAKILESADRICSQGLAIDRDDASLLYVRALLWSREPGHLDAAIACLRRAVALQPSELRLHFDLGAILSRARRDAEARDVFLYAVTLTPSDPLPYVELGRVLHALNLVREACAVYEQALRLQPDDASTHFAMADVLRSRGYFRQAAQYCESGLRLEPTATRGHCLRGYLYMDEGEWDAALTCFDTGLQLAPDDPTLHVAAGKALLSSGRVQEATKALRTALTYDPMDDQASRCLTQASDVSPVGAYAWLHRGSVLTANGHYDEAVTAFRQALVAKPDLLPASKGLVQAYIATGQAQEAVTLARSLVRVTPDDARLHVDLATGYHLLGDLERGWDECVWFYGSQAFRNRGFDRPFWDGSTLVGRTILLWTDMGRGDVIQFARFIPIVKAYGGTVVVRCHHPALIPLITKIPGADVVVSPEVATPPHDVHAPLNLFPAFFKQHRGEMGNVPYLTVDPRLHAEWRRRIGQFAGVTVGLSWGGNADTLSASSRFVSLATFASLAGIRGIRFVSLQHGPQSFELLDSPPELEVERVMNDDSSIEDVAAIVSNVDLVISVDTMIAHLAGALGTPVWTLLRYATNWRWGLQGERTPWYPTMRLFRQPRLDSWTQVFENVRAELERMARTHDGMHPRVSSNT